MKKKEKVFVEITLSDKKTGEKTKKVHELITYKKRKADGKLITVPRLGKEIK